MWLRKGYIAQHYFLVITEKFHPLLISKLYNYGVSLLSISMIFSYFSNQTHRTKINECFSERSIIEHGVPQGSILDRLLFNIDLIDLFYECEESNIASYADDTTPYSCARDTQTVISELFLNYL